MIRPPEEVSSFFASRSSIGVLIGGFFHCYRWRSTTCQAVGQPWEAVGPRVPHNCVMSALETRREAIEATAQFFNVPLEELLAADATVAEWGLPHVVTRLLEPTNADAVVATLFLAQSVEELTARDVPPTKLMSKLRNDPDLWPTWAELRAAAKIAATLPDDATFELEASRAKGKHPDFQIGFADGDEVEIEFKAIGLSDAEIEFSRRAAEVLPSLVPPHGFVTVHSPDLAAPIRLSREKRREGFKEAKKLVKNLWPGARGAAGAVIVGHGAEDNYTRRLAQRLQEAFDQFTGTKRCWAAFHWTNGAPSRLIAEALATVEIPRRVEAMVFVGSAAHPGQIHNYLLQSRRPFRIPSPDTTEVISETPDMARGVLQRVEESASVRPTILRVPTKRGMRDLIRRGGEERILPFNLVLDSDPHWVASARAAEFSPGSDPLWDVTASRPWLS
jgi:hypothetical protein